VTAFGYDQVSQLVTDGTAATYAYNGDGLRTSKTVAGTTTQETWSTLGTSPTLLVDGSTDYLYGSDGLPLEQINGSAVLYYLHDQLGSTRVLTGSTGAVVGTYTYSAYGQLVGSTGSASNPFGLAGAYTDAESGLIYLIHRYYDSGTGQFISVDPLVSKTGQSYGYATNDPLDETDPTGLDTLGYCGTVGASFLGPAGFASGCLTRTVDENTDQIGVVGTIAGGGSQSLSAFAAGAVQITNATSLSQLAGPFAYALVNVGDLYGGTVIVFAGKSKTNENIFGIEIGGGYTGNFSEQIPGAPFTIGGGVQESRVAVFGHFWETIPADLAWDVIGFAIGHLPTQDILSLARSLLNECSV
jgi:RHS repeat-associated protein